MKNILKAALIIGSLSTSVVAFADAPAKAADPKTPAASTKAPASTPAKDSKTPASKPVAAPKSTSGAAPATK